MICMSSLQELNLQRRGDTRAQSSDTSSAADLKILEQRLREQFEVQRGYDNTINDLNRL